MFIPTKYTNESLCYISAAEPANCLWNVCSPIYTALPGKLSSCRDLNDRAPPASRGHAIRSQRGSHRNPSRWRQLRCPFSTFSLHSVLENSKTPGHRHILAGAWDSEAWKRAETPAPDCYMSDRSTCALSHWHFFFRAAPAAYGGYQTRGWIRAIAASLRHSHIHSSTRSETCLWPTPQIMATRDP